MSADLTAAECPNCRCRDMGGDVAVYPHMSGGVLVIGPQCIAAADGSVINWKGQNYVPRVETSYPKPPAEPTKDGYVGILASEYGTNHHVYRYLGDDGHAYRIVGLAGGSEAHGLSWGIVLQAGTFTAVTS